MNRAIHIAATTQIRLDTEGRTYYRRKIAAGKNRMEAMRCLKRRISDVVFRQLVADAQAFENKSIGASPGGHCGASQESSAVDLPRTSTLRISHFPDSRNRRYNRPRDDERQRPPRRSRRHLDNRGEPKRRTRRVEPEFGRGAAQTPAT